MRCAACDAILLPHEGKWDAERGEFEDLCSKCLAKAYDAADVDSEFVLDLNIDSEVGDGC